MTKRGKRGSSEDSRVKLKDLHLLLLLEAKTNGKRRAKISEMHSELLEEPNRSVVIMAALEEVWEAWAVWVEVWAEDLKDMAKATFVETNQHPK